MGGVGGVSDVYTLCFNYCREWLEAEAMVFTPEVLIATYLSRLRLSCLLEFMKTLPVIRSLEIIFCSVFILVIDGDCVMLPGRLVDTGHCNRRSLGATPIR